MSKNPSRTKTFYDSRAGNISEYPKHVESFETYYRLGEHRSLKQAALIRFQILVPNYPLDVPENKKKFDSFYRKIKRWAAKENWNEWVKRRERERRKKEA